MPGQAAPAKPHQDPSRPARLHQRTAASATALLEFTDPAAEHQFQQSFAAGRRYWDVLTALLVVAYVNFLALEARLCPCTAGPATCPDSPPPARHQDQLLRTFPCATAPAGKLAQVAWWLRHWGPATLALYRIDGNLEGYAAHLFPMAALLWLLCMRGAGVRGGGYSVQRNLLMTIWRAGKAVSGILVLVAYKLQQLPGWPAHTLEMCWGRSTVFASTRMIWHVYLMPVGVLVSLSGWLPAACSGPVVAVLDPDCAASGFLALRQCISYVATLLRNLIWCVARMSWCSSQPVLVLVRVPEVFPSVARPALVSLPPAPALLLHAAYLLLELLLLLAQSPC
jgi:hypothetical protein